MIFIFMLVKDKSKWAYCKSLLLIKTEDGVCLPVVVLWVSIVGWWHCPPSWPAQKTAWYAGRKLGRNKVAAFLSQFHCPGGEGGGGDSQFGKLVGMGCVSHRRKNLRVELQGKMGDITGGSWVLKVPQIGRGGPWKISGVLPFISRITAG